MHYTNLLAETVGVLTAHGKTHADVRWVGSPDMRFAWAYFAQLAEQTNYDAVYGRQEVARDLLVVGEDWWLERREYDGSEGWEYKQLPAKPAVHRIPDKLVGDVYATLAKLNSPQDE